MTTPTLSAPLASAAASQPGLSPGPRRSTALVTILSLWLVIFFASLFAPPLLDDADATHANAARNMVLTGDLVTLKVNGIRYLEKAALPYWLDAISFRVFGFNAFAAHLPEAIGVLLLALLGFHWSRRAYGDRAAFYTGIAILTSAGVFLFTRIYIPEVLLSLFLSTALYCLLRTMEAHSDRRLFLGSRQRSGRVGFSLSPPSLCDVDRPRSRRAHQGPGRAGLFLRSDNRLSGLNR